MRMIFKVSYYVRSNYENKQGKSPLMIRIFLNGEMLNVGSSGIYIDKKLWNNSTNRVKGRGSESLNLNAQLDNISNSLQMIFKKHEFDEDLTLDKIKSIFLGKNKVKTTFVEFYDKYLEDIKAQVGAGKSIQTWTPTTPVQVCFQKKDTKRNSIFGFQIRIPLCVIYKLPVSRLMGLHLKQSRHVRRQTENILVFFYIFCVEKIPLQDS